MKDSKGDTEDSTNIADIKAVGTVGGDKNAGEQKHGTGVKDIAVGKSFFSISSVMARVMLVSSFFLCVVLVFWFFGLGSFGESVRQATLGEGVIPRSVLFNAPEKSCVRISPNGSIISYLAPTEKHQGVLNVMVARKDDVSHAVRVTDECNDSIKEYYWAFDNSHVLYLRDSNGDENYHLYSTDVNSKQTIDLTPFQGVKTEVVKVSYKHPTIVVIALNKRVPQFFDLYKVDINTGGLELLFKNDKYLSVTVDDNFVVRLGERADKSGNFVIEDISKLAKQQLVERRNAGDSAIGNDGATDSVGDNVSDGVNGVGRGGDAVTRVSMGRSVGHNGTTGDKVVVSHYGLAGFSGGVMSASGGDGCVYLRNAVVGDDTSGANVGSMNAEIYANQLAGQAFSVVDVRSATIAAVSTTVTNGNSIAKIVREVQDHEDSAKDASDDTGDGGGSKSVAAKDNTANDTVGGGTVGGGTVDEALSGGAGANAGAAAGGGAVHGSGATYHSPQTSGTAEAGSVAAVSASPINETKGMVAADRGSGQNLSNQDSNPSKNLPKFGAGSPVPTLSSPAVEQKAAGSTSDTREGGVSSATDPLVRQLMVIRPEEFSTTYVIDFTKDGKKVYMSDARATDTAGLSLYDLDSGSSEEIYLNDKADIDSVMLHHYEKVPEAVFFTNDKLQYKVLSRDLQEDFNFLTSSNPDEELRVVDRNLNDNLWVISYSSDTRPTSYYLYDRLKNEKMLLFSSNRKLGKFKLLPMYPVTIEARDGLKLRSYLTLPKDRMQQGIVHNGNGEFDTASVVPAKDDAMVIFVHGGPIARDVWRLSAVHQWAANRGYAVLSVNYRGSSGFGKSFVRAGFGEWGRKMHTDILDAVEWAVNNKIASRDQIAIVGGSYGGYEALIGLTQAPQVFSCAIDIAGPTDLVSLAKTIPPYWAPMSILMDKMLGGDAETSDGSEVLSERSPISYVDNIVKPLLIVHGDNDQRVKEGQVDALVKSMQKREIPVTYMSYSDEGHGLKKETNRLALFTVMEYFLAHNFGKGECEPVDSELVQESSLKIAVGANEVSQYAPDVYSALQSRNVIP